jgi:hypothetical protein
VANVFRHCCRCFGLRQPTSCEAMSCSAQCLKVMAPDSGRLSIARLAFLTSTGFRPSRRWRRLSSAASRALAKGHRGYRAKAHVAGFAVYRIAVDPTLGAAFGDAQVEPVAVRVKAFRLQARHLDRGQPMRCSCHLQPMNQPMVYGSAVSRCQPTPTDRNSKDWPNDQQVSSTEVDGDRRRPTPPRRTPHPPESHSIR